MLFATDSNALLSGIFPPDAGRPLAKSYWLGNSLIRPPVMDTPRALMSPPPPSPPSAGPSLFQQQIGQGNDNGSNTVGGASTSTAAAPSGFASSGEANRASSPSVGSPSMSTVGSVGGGLLSLATNLPGLGMLGSGIGGYLDAQRASADLAAIGHTEKSVDPGKAALASIAGIGPISLAPNWTTAGQISNMDLGLSPRGVAEMADFARNYDGMGFTGFDSPELDAALGLNLASLSPLSAAMSPAGLLGWSGYAPDITSLGSPGLGGYGNLGTAHSYGFVDGNLVSNFTGNEVSNDTGGGGAMGGHGGNSNGQGGSDPDGNGNWRVGGYTGDDGDKRLEPIRNATVHEREYVLRPEAVAYYGRGLLDQLNARQMPRGLLGWSHP